MLRTLKAVVQPNGLVAVALLAALALDTRVAAAGDSWPQFRGPGGQGQADDQDLPLTWSESDGVAWKTPLPGRGWSSPIVADGRIWLTTAIEQTPTHEQRQSMLKAVAHIGVASQMEAVASVALSAVEIDLQTGRLLRAIDLFNIEEPPPIHGLNSYASPSPVIDGPRLICHFGAMGTACIDTTTGKVLWRRRLEINHIVGPGSSPIVHHGLVILTCDGSDKQFIAALDATSGERIWQVDRPPIRIADGDMRKAYCTPLAIEASGRGQLVIPGAQWFIAYDPATGDELWRIDHGSGFSNVPRPLFDGELIYLNTGFVKPQLWAVRPTGSGDVGDTHVVWRHGEQMPTMSSPVMANGRIYAVSDGGVATCLDAADGRVVWRQRVPGKYSASLLMGAGRVYLCSHEGRTTVLAASDKFEKLAENDIDGPLMASPAAVEGKILLRTDSHLYCLTGEESGR